MSVVDDADKELTDPFNGASRSQRLHATLKRAFPGAAVTVVDQSAAHAGHAGARPDGETHFRVEVVWEGFRVMTRVARHQAVNEAVAAEFDRGLHALAIEARPA